MKKEERERKGNESKIGRKRVIGKGERGKED